MGSAQRCTHRDLAELVEYAHDRGIVIIPEINLPGHSAAMLNAHPEVGVMQHVEGRDVAYVDPSRFALWEFLRAVYAQMLEVTGSHYLHLGSDEAFRMPGELFTDFVRRASALVRELGAGPIAYQEASRAGLNADSLDTVQDRDHTADVLGKSVHRVCVTPPSPLTEPAREREVMQRYHRVTPVFRHASITPR